MGLPSASAANSRRMATEPSPRTTKSNSSGRFKSSGAMLACTPPTAIFAVGSVCRTSFANSRTAAAWFE